MKIFFLIRSLENGGAERQLVDLAKGLAEKGHEVIVATFYGQGRLEQELNGTAVRLFSLGKTGRWDILPFLARLVGMVRRERPDILHGYLGTANVLVTLLKLFVGRETSIVWGVRSSYMDLKRYDRLMRWSYRIECALSRFADLIVVNSEAGREYAASQGMSTKHMQVVSNGIDTSRFQPNPQARAAVRKQWGVSASVVLVGHVGRLDPMKDHKSFLLAAARLAKLRPEVGFVCVGGGSSGYAQALHEQTDSLGLSRRLVWAGERFDMEQVYPALDMLCSSSIGEGFPNVIGEAMACGVPCATTDVGDCRVIVGELGEVAKPSDPEELAQAMERVWDRTSGGELRAEDLRTRIQQQFSLERMVKRVEAALLALIKNQQ